MSATASATSSPSPAGPAPAIAPAPPLTPDWTDTVSGPRGEMLAYAALLERWNVAPGDQPPCSLRGPGGLRCVQGRDGLDDLRRLNLPAVVELKAPDGRTQYAALVHVGRDQAVLQSGDRLRRVAVPTLNAQWTRRYTVLWRPPPGWTPQTETQLSGPQVEWIRQRLTRLDGVPARTLPPRLEGALKTRLRAFQADEGLRITGTGDLRTLVHLASRTEADAPVLEVAANHR